jgi:hypothetical protein
VSVSKRSLQEVADAIASAKVRAMWPRAGDAGDDSISVPLVDGISYTQLALLSAALGTTEIYVDVALGDSGSVSVPGYDHAVLTINWSQEALRNSRGPRAAEAR